jgi:hypothetical protein
VTHGSTDPTLYTYDASFTAADVLSKSDLEMSTAGMSDAVSSNEDEVPFEDDVDTALKWRGAPSFVLPA